MIMSILVDTSQLDCKKYKGLKTVVVIAGRVH